MIQFLLFVWLVGAVVILLLLVNQGQMWSPHSSDRADFWWLLFILAWPVIALGMLLYGLVLYLSSFWRVLQALVILAVAGLVSLAMRGGE